MRHGHGRRYSLSSLDCLLQTCGASYSRGLSVLNLDGALQRTFVILSETGGRGGAAMEPYKVNSGLVTTFYPQVHISAE